ncbi:unnamed protein product, partial [Rotaria magnacalcarata]
MVTAASHILASFLTKELSPIVGTISPSHLKNVEQFYDEIGKLVINPDMRMTSFDVTSMYTNVPIDWVCDYLADYLQHFPTTYDVSTTIKLIRLCTVGTYFTFEGSYYKQIFGLQMGAKLSPIIANICLEIYETTLAPDIIQESYLWLRYMDDVYSLWPRRCDLIQILRRLNSLHTSLKFTLELEDEHTLPFLDLATIREEDRILFKIYRKPSNNNLIINYYSNHHKKHKHSALSSMYLRALKYVSPQFCDEEFNIIKNIGTLNNFPIEFIDLAFEKAKKSFYNVLPLVKFDVMNTLCLAYNLDISMLRKPLLMLGIKLIYKYNHKMCDILVKNSPSCQTNILVTERVAQHQQCVRANDSSNALNVHYGTCNQDINWNQPITLINLNDYFSRNMLEAAIIKLTWQNNVNITLGT